MYKKLGENPEPTLGVEAVANVVDVIEKEEDESTSRVRELSGNDCVLGDEEYEQNWCQNVKSLELEPLLKTNDDLFAKSMLDLKESSITTHKIDTQGAAPIRQPLRRLPFHMKVKVEKKIRDMIESGVIVPSKSEWCCAIVPVRKKDGKLRICVDYKPLNKITKKIAIYFQELMTH
jgi:hypothetical protein